MVEPDEVEVDGIEEDQESDISECKCHAEPVCAS